jgi:hypothetical protein
MSHALSNRELLAAAKDAQLVVSITYVSRNGEATQRDIEVVDVDQEYCYAYCRLRQDIRCFRLKRIQKASLTADAFLPRGLTRTNLSPTSGPHNVSAPPARPRAQGVSPAGVPIWPQLIATALLSWLLSPLGFVPVLALLILLSKVCADAKQNRPPRYRWALVLGIVFVGTSVIHDATVDSYASASCADGSYSYSANDRGTCSHHGGVVEWHPRIPPWWEKFGKSPSP